MQRPVVANDQREVAVNRLTARSYHLKVLARPVTPSITHVNEAIIVNPQITDAQVCVIVLQIMQQLTHTKHRLIIDN